MRIWRLTTTLLLLLCLSAAAAQCSREPGSSVVTLPDFLAVYFQNFYSDAANDAAEFYGGVCVTAVGGEWTVLAEAVRVEGLSGELSLSAPNPTLYLGAWRVSGEFLTADLANLLLVNAKVVGPDAKGSASELKVDLASGALTMFNLELAGSSFMVRGSVAELRGEALQVQGAGLTTCIGLDPAPYEVESTVALVNLGEREVRLENGELRIGGLRFALVDDLVVSEETFANFKLPLKVAFVPGRGGAPEPGAGLAITVVGIPVAPGVKLDVGATGLDADHPTRPAVLLVMNDEHPEADGATTTVSANAGLEGGAPYFDLSVKRPLAPWLDLGFTMVSGARPAQVARQEGKVALSAQQPVKAMGGQIGAELFAAVTAITPSAAASQPTVAGPRLGAAVSAKARSTSTVVGTFSIDTRAEATYYPPSFSGSGTNAAALQWGVRLAPAWRYSSGPVTMSLGYDARFTNSASPFGTGVDRLTPLQRASGSVTLSGNLGQVGASPLSGTLSLRSTYDLLPSGSTPAGLKELRAAGGLTLSAQPWTVSLSSVAELSGLIAPSGRDPYLQLGVSAERLGWPVLNPSSASPNVPHGSLELGVLTSYSLKAGSEGFTRLELRTGVPLAFDKFELRPFLAFDFAPTFTSGLAPRWSGYGLDATFITCCGSLTLGVLNDRGNWGASIGVDLERRPPIAAVPEAGIMPPVR